MKLPVGWLKEHLATEADAQTIADRLTSIGLEVEGIDDPAARLAAFVVGHVVTADKHPNADKLRLCAVDDGSGSLLQIVCGAPNARAGLKTVLARPGTVIPASGEPLKVGTIRGVESRGMLCSASELQLSSESDGIIELPGDAVAGTPVAPWLGLGDPVIEVSITPNRGDAASVYGAARDLAAAGLGALKDGAVPSVPGRFASGVTAGLTFPDAKADACPLLALRVVRGVKNGPSPAWLQRKLAAIGQRSISALVDITNLIAHDRGRPLHVFDAAKVGNAIVARPAREGETITALDGRTYTLDAEMTVIADETRALGIAGVTGGEESGCLDATTDVVIESAWFDPVRTARTGRKLGIVSDARYRFERGVDPAFVLPGLELATKLILDLCGGEASEISVAGNAPPAPAAIAFDPGHVRTLTGLELRTPEIAGILIRLGFNVSGSGTLSVAPPSWRGDIAGPADLVEEVMRIHGLSQVPSTPLPRPFGVARPVLTAAQTRVRTIRRAASARGFNETVSFSFISQEQAMLFGGGDTARRIKNPIAADLDSLRPSVLPSLLAAAARNAARGQSDLMLFELGPQFDSGEPEGQTLVACGLRVGNGARDWTKSGHAANALDAKADMLALIETAMGAPMTAPIKPGAAAWYHPGRSGTLALGPVASSSEAVGQNKNKIAQFGEVHPAILDAFGLKVPAAAFEIFMPALPASKSKGTARAPVALSPYQAIERDFAFVVDAGVSADAVLRAARGAERALIDSVTLFDVYAGKGVPEGRKSLAVAVRMQPAAGTLTEAEIEAVSAKIVAAVTKATGAVLRA